MEVSSRIVQLREMQGISTNKLAGKAGISQSYLRDIELGKKNPTIEMLSYICDALKISLKEFFSEEEFNIHPLLRSAIEKLSDREQIKLAEMLHEMKKNNI